MWSVVAQSVLRLATGWTVLEWIPGVGQIFRTRPDRPSIPLSLLYNHYQVPFPAVKRSERGVVHPFSSSTEVKKRVKLYLYSPPAPSGYTLPLHT